MNTFSKKLLFVLILIIAVSVFYTFYKYIVQKEYTIMAHVSCDPHTESCFFVPCEEADCPTEIEYYKLITKDAANIELCDPNNAGCDPLVCKDGEMGCAIISCSADTASEGEQCSTPD